MTAISTEALPWEINSNCSKPRRAAFAQLLLASLDEDAEIEDAWAAETERRIGEIESGAVQTIPIADALAQVRAALK